MGRHGQMQDGQANTGTLVGMAVGIPAVATVGLVVYWMALGDMPAFQHIGILALCFGTMLGAYLGGLLGMMYVYETGERLVTAPPRKAEAPEDIQTAA